MNDFNLIQGQIFVGDYNNRVSTLLGSCVSIILWHPYRKIGAISHCLLDTRQKNIHHENLDSKYCDEAIKIMIYELQKIGIHINDCQAKIFGGASINPLLRNAQVGLKNCNVAIQELEKYNIAITDYNLFGKEYRKIIFDINTGVVVCDNKPNNYQ